MSALAEALVAAQRRTLAAMEKFYVAGAIDAEQAKARNMPRERISALIEALKAGTYDPTEWDVPF